MSRRERIFLSSVQKELAEERRAVRDYVSGDPLLRRYFEVFLFEDLPASDVRPDQAYLQEVDRCDLYVALLGDDYGYEDADGISPTEREFDRATEKRRERLIFIRGNDDSTRHPKMRSLIRKAGDQLIRRRVAGIPDLLAALYASLVEHLERTGTLRTLPFDAAACPRATLDDLSEERLTGFLERAQHNRGYALAPGTPLPKALAHLNLLDGDKPSHAAVLLFGKAPQRFLPTSEVKCMHFHGTTVRKPIPSYQIYKGSVFELVDKAVDFVMSKLARSVGTRAAGPEAPVEYEIPGDAVAEAIVNAVAHRDYASNASVQVMLFADRLEVWNPGELPPSLTFEALRRPHASIPRNPLLAEPFFLVRLIEKAGTGTLDMIELCENAGLPAPVFRQDGGQFVQTLWRSAAARGEVPASSAVREAVTGAQSGARSGAQSGAQSTEQAIQVLRNLLQGPRSSQELATALGLKSKTGALKRTLSDLVGNGFIELTIPGKPQSRLQRYRITAAGTKSIGEKTDGDRSGKS